MLHIHVYRTTFLEIQIRRGHCHVFVLFTNQPGGDTYNEKKITINL